MTGKKRARVPAKREPKLPLIGLVLVVKDGEATLPMMLSSVLSLIGTYTVCDTGSTDATRAIVKSMLGHLPGTIVRHKWESFGANYTKALAKARGSAQWLLHMHADEQVTFINDGLTRWLGGRKATTKYDGFDVTILDHGLRIALPRLIRGDLAWRYEFPTHEYLVTEGKRIPPLSGLQITHHGHGKGRPELERDLALLKPLFEKGNPRAIFYTAECHRYLGNFTQAKLIYEIRASMDGSENAMVKLPSWEEERWYAQYQAAYLGWDIEGLIEAWRARPWRHEPLSAAAYMISDHGKDSTDVIFREPFGQPWPLPKPENWGQDEQEEEPGEQAEAA